MTKPHHKTSLFGLRRPFSSSRRSFLGLFVVGSLAFALAGEGNAAPVGKALPEMNAIWTLAISPDSKTIATGGEEETVSLWDVATSKIRKVLPRQKPHVEIEKNYVFALNYSPTGKELAIGYGDASIVLWNQDNGSIINTGSMHQGSIYAVAFSADGKWMASGANSSEDDVVKIWDATTGAQIGIVDNLQFRAQALAFSPDSKYFACSTADGSIVLLEIEGNKVTVLSPPAAPAPAPTIGIPNPVIPGGIIPMPGMPGMGEDGLQTPRVEATDFARTLAFSPDSTTLIVGTTKNEIKRWNVQTKEPKSAWKGSAQDIGGISSVAFSPDGKRILVCNGVDNAGPVELRDAVTGRILDTLTKTSTNGAGAFAPNGKFVAVGSRGAEDPLTIWTLD
jgi:WD40 repeat protein